VFLILSKLSKEEGFHDYSIELKVGYLTGIHSYNRTELLREFGINYHQVGFEVHFYQTTRRYNPEDSHELPSGLRGSLVSPYKAEQHNMRRFLGVSHRT
jgi:hypothetical protein